MKKLDYDQLRNIYNNSQRVSEKEKIATIYLSRAKNEKNNIRIAKGYYLKALLNFKTDKIKALKLLDSSILYSKNDRKDTLYPMAPYCDKAIILTEQHRYKDAITNYKLAEKAALTNNIDFYYIIRGNIAITKSENLGEVEEALVLYKECYNYYKNKSTRSKKYLLDYHYSIFGLADVYKSLKQVDSCAFYNKLGYIETKATKNENFHYMFILNEGANQILKKNYKAAIDSINKALPKLESLKNTENIFASFFYYGKAYEGLNKNELAVINYKKVDSIYELNNEIMTPEFTSGYRFLIKYYKQKNDNKNQLKYLSKYMEIDSVLQNNYKELNNLLKKEYDFPYLQRDKEALINSLKNKNNYFIWGVVGLIVLILILILYQQSMKKIYHLRFEEIIKEAEINKNSETVTIEKNFVESKNATISKEIIDQIIQKLKLFEKEKGYINSKISINSLADEFETNSKYLSKIVNEYKEKSFVTYINDLRIDYIILVLKEDKKMRKYNLQAIAIECGFNSAESFSTAFFKKTGIKPSFFIKELDKNSN
ncbi:helix-turn-helix domain-containing protein [Flavobacterium sp.]|uniref:helix-turn-helix domain-containing protein n=1 Tax=Flavobacterium sp. TaxID=239 RepID=UPI0037C0CA98